MTLFLNTVNIDMLSSNLNDVIMEKGGHLTHDFFLI